MRWIGFGASAALVFLISSCADGSISRVQLPEPPLPACLVEEAPQDRHPVGAFQFAPSWIAQAREIDDPRGKVAAALSCAADVARSLREAIGAIRLNNQAGR